MPQRNFDCAFWPSASSAPWLHRSVGFVGISDGWQDLSKNFRMTWEYTQAENGNIALTRRDRFGGVQRRIRYRSWVSAEIWSEAGQVARSSLLEPYEELRKQYAWHWRDWQDNLLKLDQPQREIDLYRASAAVLRVARVEGFSGGGHRQPFHSLGF